MLSETKRVAQLELWRRNRATFFQDKYCSQCQSTVELELHHVDPAKKVDSTIWNWRQERRAAEIAKCIVLCRSCHSELHASQLRRHSTTRRYRLGCRCDECREVYQAKRRNYLARRKLGDVAPASHQPRDNQQTKPYLPRAHRSERFESERNGPNVNVVP